MKTDTTIKIYRDRKPEIYKPADSSLTHLYTQEALHIIQTQRKDQPFFIYLAYNMPHLPVAFAASASYLQGKQEGGPLGAVVEDLDSNIAVLWHTLEEKGMANNTIIAFSSDNGPWIEFPIRESGDSVTKRWHAGTAGMFRGSRPTPSPATPDPSFTNCSISGMTPPNEQTSSTNSPKKPKKERRYSTPSMVKRPTSFVHL